MYPLVLPASPVAWPDPSSNIHLLFMTRLHKLLLSQNQNQPTPCLHCSAVSVLFASPVSEGRTVCIIPWEVKHHTAHMHRCPAAPNHRNHFYPILRLSWRFQWLDCCIFSSELWIKLVHMQVRCSYSLPVLYRGSQRGYQAHDLSYTHVSFYLNSPAHPCTNLCCYIRLPDPPRGCMPAVLTPSVCTVYLLSLVAVSSVSAWYCDLSLSLIPFCSVCLCWLLACCQPLKCMLVLHWSNNFTLSTDYRTLTQAICWCWDTSALFSPKFKFCVFKERVPWQ